MTVYIFNIFYILILKCYVSIFVKNKNQDRIYIAFAGFWIFLTLILRDESIGSDLRAYLRRYTVLGNTVWEKLPQVSSELEFELGYSVLNKLLYCLFPDERTIIYVTAVVFILGFCIWIYRKSEDACFSFLIFICLGLYGGCLQIIRQMIATIITMMSYKYLVEGNLKKFVLTTLAAALFHTSALCILPMYFFRYIKINLRLVFIWITGSLICIWGGIKIVSYISYKETYAKMIAKGSNGEWGLVLINLFIIFLMFLVYYRKNNLEERLFLHYEIIFLFLSILTFVLPMVSRISGYYKTILVISIPHTVKRIKNKYTRVIVELVIILVFLFYYFFIICRADAADLIPYRFMWS